MTIVNVHEAKTHLSRLLERVEQGEEIVIARNNQPIARLVAHIAPERRPGSLRGRMRIADDFNDPLPDEVADAFGG